MNKGTRHKTISNIQHHLLMLLFILIAAVANSETGMAQSLKNDIHMSFVKDSSIVKANELYFNTLKIWNSSLKPYKGEVLFSGPSNWRIISFATNEISIQPNDTLWIPLRVASAPDASGAITYLVHGAFRVGNHKVSATSYLTVLPISKWDFNTNSASTYLTESYPYTSFQVRLQNKGNTNELIKLDYKLGKTLALHSNNSNYSSMEYISLPAYKDTTIVRTVTLRQDLTDAEKVRYEQNWKESAILVSASSGSDSQSSEIQIKKLYSKYKHHRAQTNTPLNFDLSIYNLMSNQLPRTNLNIYGNILFEGNSELQYNTGIQNFMVSDRQNFDINRQLVYYFRYTDIRNNILLSYNTYSGGLHSINGRGLSGNFNIDKLNNVSYAVIQNPFSNDVGGSVGYSTQYKKVSLNTQVTHEFNPKDGYKATSLLAGAGFTFNKYHRFNLNLLGSYASYQQVQGRDTASFGLSYRFNYSVKYKNFDLYFNGTNSSLNRIKSAGSQQYNLDSRYKLNEQIRFVFFGNLTNYSTTRYPYNFDHPVNRNSSEYARVAAVYNLNNIVYQLGPNYVGSTRLSLNTFTGFTTKFRTYQPGVWASATYRLDGYRSISPNITLGRLYVNYSNSNPDIQDRKVNNGLSYSFGLNYFDDNFKLNAYYSSGSASDLYRDYQVYEQPSITRSLQVRPSYEAYVFNRNAKVSAYVNFAYYLPTERQNIGYNVRYEHYLKDNWNVYLNGTVFSNSRKDESGGRLNTMDLNIIVGVSKSFNIQQPRIKYYDLKTIFFNDLDGDRQKSENEPPVPNILVSVSKDKKLSTINSGLPVFELISNSKGEVMIENMPRDNYNISFEPLINLESYYFLNGSEQQYYSDKDRVLYIPLVESYKIRGRLNLIRDPNSSEGKIDIDGVRIEAIGDNGETYSVLTDNHGSYILNVPNGDKFKVKIRNVFGEHFVIDNDEVTIQFGRNKTINLDFKIVEKRREINFNNGNQLFKFNSK